MTFPYLSEQEIEGAARSLLMDAFSTDVPLAPVDLDVVVFDHLAEADGLSFNDDVTLGELDGEPILGAMLPRQGRIQVCASLKDAGSPGRYRFTVAHELGHWVLHRPICLSQGESLDLFEVDLADRMISLQRNVFGSGRVPREEWQANHFAAQLLMPPDLLREAFRACARITD